MPELDLEAVLRDLPRPAFKARLRETLMEPQTVIPYLTVGPVDEVADFVKDILGAEQLVRSTGSAGGTHYSFRIGDSMLMVGGGAALAHKAMPSMLHVYVPDVDATHRRALEAGAKELGPPVDQPYGERGSAVEDAGGNQWCFATAFGPSFKPDPMRNVSMYLHPSGVPKLIDFMQRALDVRVLEQHAMPDGTIAHAKLQMGNTIIEMGEAHGQWTPMPTMLYCNVADADAAYEHAIAEGGKSVVPPGNAPYAGRMAAIEDPAGNQWYFASPSPK